MVAGIKTFNRGHVKTTDLQIKKHYTQMTERDINILYAELYNIKKLKKSSHLIEKIENNEVTLRMKDVYKSLHHPNIKNNIIEYNETYRERENRIVQRVLIRLLPIRNLKIANVGVVPCYTYVVIDLTTKQIITSYLNHVEDNHKSIDMSRYKGNMVVRYAAKGGISPKGWQNV